MLSQILQPAQRILVADDDPVIRHLLTSILRKAGYTVVVVNDGREAYGVLQKDADFAATIFDMMMPHLEGTDIIRFMRTEERLKRIPAMMITSEIDPKVMAASFAAGATVLLPKPFTTDQLKTMLRMLLNNKSLALGKVPTPKLAQESVARA
jgi:CheY-like chemotaxis protein